MKKKQKLYFFNFAYSVIKCYKGFRLRLSFTKEL